MINRSLVAAPASFTPGPWRIGKFGGSVVADVPGCIPFLDGENLRAYGGYLVGETIQPENARLIIEAPTMFGLLEQVQCYCPVSVQDEIRALVARVKGGAR